MVARERMCCQQGTFVILLLLTGAEVLLFFQFLAKKFSKTLILVTKVALFLSDVPLLGTSFTISQK